MPRTKNNVTWRSEGGAALAAAPAPEPAPHPNNGPSGGAGGSSGENPIKREEEEEEETLHAGATARPAGPRTRADARAARRLRAH